MWNNITNITNSSRSYIGQANKESKQIDVGKVTFDKKAYNYKIPSMGSEATMTITSSSVSEDKTVSFEMLFPIQGKAPRIYKYGFIYNKKKRGFLGASITLLKEINAESKPLYTKEKQKILAVLGEIMSKEEKGSGHLRLLRVIYDGTKKMETWDKK